MKNQDHTAYEDILGCGRLSPDLESELLDAAGGQSPSEALSSHMQSCSACRDEVKALSRLTRLMEEDAAMSDPGAHFFQTLHDDVMGNLGPQGGPDVPSDDAVGVAVKGYIQEKRPWYRALWAFLTDKPVWIAVGTAAAIAALVMLWPVEEPALDQGAVVQEDSVQEELDGLEGVGVEALASAVEIDLGGEEDDLYAAWGDGDEVEDSGAYWSAGASGNLGGLSEKEFDAVLVELRQSL